jgi:hypothetical protein
LTRLSMPRLAGIRGRKPTTSRCRSQELVWHAPNLCLIAMLPERVDNGFHVRGGGPVGAEQREDTRLAGRAAHLLDGGNVEVGREVVWVEEAPAGCEIELAVSECEVRQLVRPVAAFWAPRREIREKATHDGRAEPRQGARRS